MRRIHIIAQQIAKATKHTTTEGDPPTPKRGCRSCGSRPRLARDAATDRQAEITRAEWDAALAAHPPEFES